MLSAAANPFSVGVWVKVNIPLADGQGIYHIISDEDYQNNGWVLRVRGDSGAEGKIEFRMSSGVSGNEDNTYTAPAGSYPDDQEWHHLLAVRPENGGDGKVYVDGVEIAGTIAGNWDVGSASLQNLYIGKYSSSVTTYQWEGEISKVRLYNRALSADEVKASYSGQAVPFEYTEASQTNRVTNGTFAADTDWTKGTGWTIGSGVATSAGGNDGAYLSQVPSHSPSMIGKYLSLIHI